MPNTKYSNSLITFLILVLINIFIRLKFFQFDSFQIDMGTFQAWALKLAQEGPINFYSPNYFSDYLPGYLYILLLLGKIYTILSAYLNVNFDIILKISTNIFDFLTAYYIYKILNNNKSRWATVAAFSYIYNPVVIFNSSVWGQVDSIPTFFVVLSTYFLLEKNKLYSSSLGFGLAVIIKPQILSIFPSVFLNTINHFSIKKIVPAVIVFLGTIILVSLPFFITSPILGLIGQIQKATIQYPYTTLFAFNIWNLVGNWIPDSNKWANFTYQQWGFFIYVLSVIFIVSAFFFKKVSSNKLLIYLSSALLIFSFFMFPTRIHERYLYPIFAFLVICAGFLRSKGLGLIYLILSVLHFLNLWYVYFYYNYVYKDSVFAQNIFYITIDQNQNLIVLLTFFLFITLMIIYSSLVKIVLKNDRKIK